VGETETTAALAGCVIGLAALVFYDRRPYRPGKLNVIPLMIVLAVACIILGHQLVDLLR
jgi:hypothetical protein